jgi:hypothetical protein
LPIFGTCCASTSRESNAEGVEAWQRSEELIRIPLRDLKVAFSNPTRFVRSFKPDGSSGGLNKYSMFLHAIGTFHKTNDLAKAQDYLERVVTKNFEDIADLPDYAKRLSIYVREWRRQGNSLVRYRDNIAIPISENYSGFIVSGQAARVDLLLSGGYGVWIFGRNVPDWGDDPRLPLLQYSYAERLDVAMDSINVGIYDFGTGAYATRRYSTREVNAARRNLDVLLGALSVRFPSRR